MQIQQRLIESSPRVESEDPLVAFLYLLMRDHMPSADVLKIVHDVVDTQSSESRSHVFTNGHLAGFAVFLANELRKPT